MSAADIFTLSDYTSEKANTPAYHFQLKSALF